MSDHLTPVEGYFSVANHSYHLQVRETLLADFSPMPLAGLVVLPSFEPEYALWVGKDWRRHYAIYRVAELSIWKTIQNPLAKPVACTTHQVELPVALAQWRRCSGPRWAKPSMPSSLLLPSMARLTMLPHFRRAADCVAEKPSRYLPHQNCAD